MASYPGEGESGRCLLPVLGSSPPLATTLLSLVQALLHQGLSEEEIVRRALDEVRSGRTVLIGNFRGCRLEP